MDSSKMRLFPGIVSCRITRIYADQAFLCDLQDLIFRMHVIPIANQTLIIPPSAPSEGLFPQISADFPADLRGAGFSPSSSGLFPVIP